MKILVVEDEPDLNHIIVKQKAILQIPALTAMMRYIILQKKVMMLSCWMPCFLVKMDLKF